MKIRGSYDRIVITKSKGFDELIPTQKLKAIKKARHCGCPGCCAWLEHIKDMASKYAKQPCIFCGNSDTEWHLEMWICKDCERSIAKGFEAG